MVPAELKTSGGCLRLSQVFPRLGQCVGLWSVAEASAGLAVRYQTSTTRRQSQTIIERAG